MSLPYPVTCPAVVQVLPVQANSESKAQSDVYQTWLAAQAERKKVQQGPLMAARTSARSVSPGSAQLHYRSAVPKVISPQVHYRSTIPAVGAARMGVSASSPQVQYRSTIPTSVSPQVQYRSTIPTLALRGMSPAVAPRGVSPAVTSRGVSPAVTSRGVSPAVTSRGMSPAVTSRGMSPAVTSRGMSRKSPASISLSYLPPTPTQSIQQVETQLPLSPLSSITPAANLDHYEEEEEDKNATVQHHVFNWLNWSPDPDTACYDALHKNFPGALPGSAVHHRVAEILESPRFGFTEATTLLGASICPDEINNQVGDLADLMKNHWGGIFPLGGIGGAPFVGETGFSAFSHHVPDDGDIIILFGPHVAISGQGQVGKYLRDGQHQLSTSCGAVIGAYNACCSGAMMKGFDDFKEHDLQMEWIKTQLDSHAERIKAQTCPMGALAYQAYEMVKAKLEKIINFNFGKGRLVLVGGIQINMPGALQDHFLPIMFDVRQKDTATVNLMSAFKCPFTQIDVFSPAPKKNNSKRRSSNLAGSFPEPVLGLGMKKNQSFNEWKDTKCADFDFTAKADEDAKAVRQHKVFAWLTWSPEVGTPCFKTLHTDFPGALPGAGVACRIRSLLTDNYGFTPENTLFGSSICPDEINNTMKSLTGLMTDFWGSVFLMGGLGGVPFTGKTGFKAFSHHVPDDGNILLIYGPHVAISEEGEVGKYLRMGQHEQSTACGAIIGAYNACCNMEAGDVVEFDEADMQLAWIKSQFVPHVERIQRQDSPLAALHYQAFESVKAKVNKVVDTDFSTGRLVLIGGVQINLPPPCCDHFLPLSFEVRQAGKPTEFLEQAFHIPFPDENDQFHHQVLGA